MSATPSGTRATGQERREADGELDDPAVGRVRPAGRGDPAEDADAVHPVGQAAPAASA